MSSVLYPEFWLPRFMKLTNLPVRTFNDYQNLMTWLLIVNDNQILWNMKATPHLSPHPSLGCEYGSIRVGQWSQFCLKSHFIFKCPIKGMEVRRPSPSGLFSISQISKGQAWKSCRNAFKTQDHRQRQAELSEFKASLVDGTSPRTTSSSLRKTSFEKQTTKKHSQYGHGTKSNVQSQCNSPQNSNTIFYTHWSCMSQAGEIAQHLKLLTVLPEVLSSNPMNHIMA